MGICGDDVNNGEKVMGICGDDDYIKTERKNYRAIFDFLASAGKVLDWPVIRVVGGNRFLAFKLKYNPIKDTVAVVDLEGDMYRGLINNKGYWFSSKELKHDAVSPILDKMLVNPGEVLKSFSKHTDKCCFCSKDLTDTPSVKSGYGETCSKNWGIHKQWLRNK